jgi:ABC-type Mn2+/Zn2+ transport system permease subunit
MLDDFLIRAALAGVGLSLATGALGSFVVWRRMAYFGDATAHAAILGVALALATDLPVGLGTLAVALAMACYTTARLAAVTPLTPSAVKSARLGALFRLSLLAVPTTRLTCAAKAASSA